MAALINFIVRLAESSPTEGSIVNGAFPRIVSVEVLSWFLAQVFTYIHNVSFVDIRKLQCAS